MPQQGDKFGYYHLVKRLGAGGFAEVWLGENRLMYNEAAIKILNLQLPTAEEQEKFLDEARHLASFSHPNIVRVLECGLEGNIPFLVLEYAPNGTLRARHPKGTRLAVDVVVDYVKQVAAGLQYAHNRRLVHHDVKPDNMLIGKNNQILISDFGIAAVEKTSSFRLTKPPDEILGTPGYMAPEQFDGYPPTAASDQYALGVVVYEWLCGSLPFRGKPEEIRVQQRLKPPRVRDKVPGISPAIEQVVLTTLSEDLGGRFRDMQAFADALEQAVRNPNGPMIPIQGSQLHQNNPAGAAVPLFPNDPWSPNQAGGANNPLPLGAPHPPPQGPLGPDPMLGMNNPPPSPNPGAVHTPPQGPLGLDPMLGMNNPPPSPNPGAVHTPPQGPLGPDPMLGINNPPPSPRGPIILNPGGGINNPLVQTSPAGPYQGIPPLGPNIPYSAFHSGSTVQAQQGPFDPSVDHQGQTSGAKRRAKWFDWHNAFGFKNRLFLFGGGFVDFILAVILGRGLLSWDVWLFSLLSAWTLRLLCAATGRKYLAIPLALALVLYWFLGSWAAGIAFNITFVPPHIIAILVLFFAGFMHWLYVNKKK